MNGRGGGGAKIKNNRPVIFSRFLTDLFVIFFENQEITIMEPRSKIRNMGKHHTIPTHCL